MSIQINNKLIEPFIIKKEFNVPSEISDENYTPIFTKKISSQYQLSLKRFNSKNIANRTEEESKIKTAPQLGAMPSLQTHAPATYIPADRSGILSSYPQQFKKYNKNKNNGLKEIMESCGYRSAEEFILSNPYDIQKALKSNLKNPKQEAIEMLVTGGNRQIRHYIDARFSVYKNSIKLEKSSEKGMTTALAFFNEMEIHLQSWINYLKKDEKTIILLFEKELNSIKYKSATRWFPAGSWPYTVNKNKWIKDWPALLFAAKKNISDGLQQTRHELSASLHTKIKTLYDVLIQVAKTGIGTATDSSDTEIDTDSDTDIEIDPHILV